MSKHSVCRLAVLSPPGFASPPLDRLCHAIRQSDRHALVDWRAGTGELFPQDEWRLLCERSDVDAVLVAAADESTIEAARQLAIRGTTLVILVTATLPARFVMELSLYDAEGSSSILPWFDDRNHFEPALQWIRNSSVGQVSSLQLERTLSDETAWRSDVLLTEELLRDIDRLRLIGGDYSQVTLIRTGGAAGHFNSQTLQLAGPGLVDATCTYRRVTEPGVVRLQAIGIENLAEVQLEGTACLGRIGSQSTFRDIAPAADDRDGSACVLSQLDGLLKRSAPAATWNDVVRIFEIAEAMQRSVRRRRTIDLHFETTSERSQFKTQMTAIGCGVLLWTLFGVLGLLFAGATLDPRDRSQREAEAAGFVLRVEAFEPASERLTGSGVAQVRSIAQQLPRTDALVIVESTSQGADVSPVDAGRVQAVQEQLAETGAADGQSRVITRRLAGHWLTRALNVGWVIVFAPVGLFLGLQLLLVIAKPATRGPGSHSEEGTSTTSGV